MLDVLCITREALVVVLVELSTAVAVSTAAVNWAAGALLLAAAVVVAAAAAASVALACAVVAVVFAPDFGTAVHRFPSRVVMKGLPGLAMLTRVFSLLLLKSSS